MIPSKRNFPITVFINHFTLQVHPDSYNARGTARIQVSTADKESLPGQITDSGYHAVRIATINEIIVGTIAHFQNRMHFLRIIRNIVGE